MRFWPRLCTTLLLPASLAVVSLTPLPALCQDPQPAPQPTAPAAAGDANAKAHALLQAGLRSMGADGSTAPYHLRADYQVGVDKAAKGTIEAWSTGPDKWRRTTTGKLYHGAQWSTSRTQRYLPRDADTTATTYLTLGSLMLDPFHEDITIKPDMPLDLKRVNVGIALDCVTVSHPEQYAGTTDPRLFPVLCFDGASHLRLLSHGKESTIFDAYRTMGGRAIPGHIKRQVEGAVTLELTLTLLEPLSPTDVALVEPPRDAVEQPYALRPDDPEPVILSQATALTNVEFRDRHPGEIDWIPIVIQKDGSVKVSKTAPVVIEKANGDRGPAGLVSDGSQTLIQPLAAAARKWRFQPYTIAGQPVEVATLAGFTQDGKPWKSTKPTP
ncbi:MAG TPA: hypothetical protein VGD62_01325 [Acidobacteriaceae bacterium]